MTAAPLVHLVVAARPNFMKVAPLWRELRHVDWCRPAVIHAGQHYDRALSDGLLEELGLPEPAARLEVGSGSHAEQTAAVLVRYERVLLEERPACVVVVGDVNATLAATLAAAKLGIPVAHLEAGLRSGDRSMPEELNRIATDALADVLWAPSADAVAHLEGEGARPGSVELVGNIMIDTVELLRPQFEAEVIDDLVPSGGAWAVVTVHRPVNVDAADALGRTVDALVDLADRLPLVFPVHPRTQARLEQHGLLDRLARHPGVRLLEAQPYVRFMALVSRAALVVTDSGGVQEETTHLGIPCVTVRETTERPITITQGTNRLATWADLPALAERALTEPPGTARPPLWDGRTAGRVAESLRRWLAAWA